jgi:hypothetical protein
MVDRVRCTEASTAIFGLEDVAVVRWSKSRVAAVELVATSVLAAWISTAACSEQAAPHSTANSPPIRAEGPRKRSVDHGECGAQDEGRYPPKPRLVWMLAAVENTENAMLPPVHKNTCCDQQLLLLLT